MSSPNLLLSKARKAHDYTQEKLAAKVGVDKRTVRRWENEGQLPQPSHRAILCQLLGKSEKELGFSGEDMQASDTETPALPTVFLLYSKFDEKLADRLRRDLQGGNVDVLDGGYNSKKETLTDTERQERLSGTLIEVQAIVLIASSQVCNDYGIKKALEVTKDSNRPMHIFWMEGETQKKSLPESLLVDTYAEVVVDSRVIDARKERYPAALSELIRELDALEKQAERTFAALPSEEHQKLARVLFMRLIDVGEGETEFTRRPVIRPELDLADSQPHLLNETLEIFTKARLLIANSTVEISHEALILEWSRLSTWLREAREDIRLMQALSRDVATWKAQNRPKDRLYQGTDLVEAERWAKHNMPTCDEKSFLQTSREECNREEEERRAQQRQISRLQEGERQLDTARHAQQRQISRLEGVTRQLHNEVIKQGKTLRFVGIGTIIFVLLISSGAVFLKQPQHLSFPVCTLIHAPLPTEPVVYIGSGGGKGNFIYALQASDGHGQVRWQCQVSNSVYSSPRLVKGIIYVGSKDHNIYALGATNGSEKWVFPTNDIVESSPFVTDSAVYIGSHDHYLYAISTNDGSLLWKYQTTAPVLSSPVVAAGMVYNSSFDGNVYALDTNGNLKWKYSLKRLITSSPAVTKGVVYISADDGTICALDAGSGYPNWQSVLGTAQLASETDASSAKLDSSPIVEKDTVYVGSRDGSVYALRTKDGSKLWSFPTKAPIYSSPALVNGVIYIGSEDGCIYALNVKTQKPLWQYETETHKAILGSPAVVKGVVYIGSQDHYVYAIHADNGMLSWSYLTSGNVISLPAIGE